MSDWIEGLLDGCGWALDFACFEAPRRTRLSVVLLVGLFTVAIVVLAFV
ncbi:MAG: hypothetical protein IPJ77_13780 [Planctomycetes bacterium]|nr:hypothetical protein [Planctomycetota bacterium]